MEGIRGVILCGVVVCERGEGRGEGGKERWKWCEGAWEKGN